MKYNTLMIAKALIHACKEKNIKNINITKLHKLLYIVYGTYLYVYDKPLFDEQPVIFPYGPIFRSLHESYKLNAFLLFDNTFLEDEQVNNIFDIVLKVFGKYSAEQLAEWTKREGSAWYKVNKISAYWNVEIDNDLIKGEFSHLIIWKK